MRSHESEAIFDENGENVRRISMDKKKEAEFKVLP